MKALLVFVFFVGLFSLYQTNQLSKDEFRFTQDNAGYTVESLDGRYTFFADGREEVVVRTGVITKMFFPEQDGCSKTVNLSGDSVSWNVCSGGMEWGVYVNQSDLPRYTRSILTIDRKLVAEHWGLKPPQE